MTRFLTLARNRVFWLFFLGLGAGNLPAANFNIADGDVAGLIAAINTANTNGEADAINLAANGTYLFSAADNASNGGNALPVILNDALGPDLTIHGNGATFDKSTNTPFRYLQVNAAVSIDNVVFRFGGSSEYGGAIRVSATLNTSLSLANCSFNSNHASTGGGAIANILNASVSVTGCSFAGNQAGDGVASHDDPGGAILNQAGGTITVTNCTLNSNVATGKLGGGGIANTGAGTINITGANFASNTAGRSFAGGFNDANGGAIANTGSGMVTLTNGQLTQNSASDGGAVFNGAGTFTATDTFFAANSAAPMTTAIAGVGGAIYGTSGPITIQNCTIDGNTASGRPMTSSSGPAFGGGIYHNGALTISGSTISHNTAHGGDSDNASSANANGGGIYTAGPLTVTNCTIASNTAQGGSSFANHAGGSAAGGGIYFSSNASNFIKSTTIASNTAAGGGGQPTLAGLGGGVYVNANNGPISVKGTLIANNTAQTPDAAGNFASQGYNLIGKTDGSSSFTSATDLVGTNASPLDPKLDPNGLQPNGGSTLTIALLSGSPAIDHGSAAGANPPITTDQRGLLRTFDDPNVGNASGGDASDIGAFEVQTSAPTPTPTPTPAATATPTATPGSPVGSLGNVSTRLQVGTGNDVLFAGFIIHGSGSKTLLIRSAGPSLTSFGVPGAMTNPQLELHDADNTIGTNDDWQSTQIGGVITSNQVAAIQNSGAAPSDPAEPAIIATLPAGAYTAIVQGVGGTQGVATVEVYDLSPNNGATLANISTRGFIQTGDNVMIGGFIIVGQSVNVLIRGIGPSLIQFGISNALADPKLELHDANGTLAGNDNWQTTQLGGIITGDQSGAIQNSGLAPGNPAESAILATLAPGNYTAIAQGVNGAVGVGIVEVFALP